MEKYLIDILEQTKNNLIISDAFTKADSIINNPKYINIICSISGGADSDIMLDLIYKVDKDKKVRYVWFDTGLEYKATKEHLKYLESRYGIEIRRERERLNQFLLVRKNTDNRFCLRWCRER